jgi:hypothetical protein
MLSLSRTTQIIILALEFETILDQHQLPAVLTDFYGLLFSVSGRFQWLEYSHSSFLRYLTPVKIILLSKLTKNHAENIFENLTVFQLVKNICAL